MDDRRSNKHGLPGSPARLTGTKTATTTAPPSHIQSSPSTLLLCHDHQHQQRRADDEPRRRHPSSCNLRQQGSLQVQRQGSQLASPMSRLCHESGSSVDEGFRSAVEEVIGVSTCPPQPLRALSCPQAVSPPVSCKDPQHEEAVYQREMPAPRHLPSQDIMGENDGDDGFELIDASEAVLDASVVSQVSLRGNDGISKIHWKAPEAAGRCEACALKFDLIDKKFWCHRCGGLFCKACLQYRRKLTPEAIPDPVNGKSYTVCLKCFKEEPPQTVGPTKNYTHQFLRLRQHSLSSRDAMVRDACVALCNGYKASSKASLAVSGVLGIDAEWTKVNFCPKDKASRITVCSVCTVKFGFTTYRHHCRICGGVFCDKCLFRSVEVFKEGDGSVKVDVLHPEFERQGSIVLRGCARCLELLEQATKLDMRLQRSLSRSLETGEPVTEATMTEAKVAPSSPAFLKLIGTYPHVVDNLELLESTLELLQGKIKTLSSEAQEGSFHGLSQSLAKLEGDVKGLYASLRKQAHELKRLKERRMTATEQKVAENLFHRVTNTLANNLGPFRASCSILQEFFPDGTLEITRAIVDAEGVKNTMIFVRQMGIETLAFSELEAISGAMAALVATLHEKVVELMTRSGSSDFIDDVMDKVDAIAPQLIKERPVFVCFHGNPEWKPLFLHAWDAAFRSLYSQLKKKSSLEVVGEIEESVNKVWLDGRALVRQLQEEEDLAESEWDVVGGDAP